MYYEITPTTPLAPFVPYLDGNTDTPTDIDMQLPYLDGNQGYNVIAEKPINGEKTNPIYLPDLFAHNTTGLMEAIDISSWPFKHLDLVGYFDGNQATYTSTRAFTISGDGNKDAFDGGKPLFTVPMYLIGYDKPLAGNYRVIEGPDWTWYNGIGILCHYGPSRFLGNYRNLYTHLIANAKSGFDKTVNGIVGEIFPHQSTRYNLIDTYDAIESRKVMQTIKGSTVTRFDLQHTGKTWYKNEEGVFEYNQILLLKSALDDGTGNIYNSQGVVVDNVDRHSVIVVEPDIDNILPKTIEPRYPKNYITTSYHNPIRPEDNYHVHYTPQTIHDKDNPVLIQHIDTTDPESQTHELTQIIDMSDMNHPETTVTIKLKPIATNKVDGWPKMTVQSSKHPRSEEDPNIGWVYIISDNTIEGDEAEYTIEIDGKWYDSAFFSIRTKYNDYDPAIWATYEYSCIVDKFFEQEVDILNPVDPDPRMYLFDITIYDRWAHTDDGIYVYLGQEHKGLRLKGPVLFGLDFEWCVLEYVEPGKYLITDHKPIEDINSVYNKDIFPAIENNKRLII